MNGKFISLASIIERAYANTEYENIPWQDAAEWVIDCLRLIGVSQSYVDKCTNGNDNNPIPIVINNFKGEIPLDVIVAGPCRLIELNGNDEIVGFTTMLETTDLFYQSPTVLEAQNTSVNNLAGSIAPTSIEQRLNDAQEQIDAGELTDAGDALDDIVEDVKHASLRASSSNFIGSNFTPKYKLNNGYIYTNFNHGFVEMSYKSYPVDEFGMPMIPDDQRFIEAVKWYIISNIDYKRWRITRNSADERIFNSSDRQRDWYVASARSKGHMPSLDMIESIKNMMLRSIPKLNEHKTGFKNTNIIEQRRF